MVEESATIRQAAKKFGCSKTSVVNYLNQLQDIDKILYNDVRRIIEYNKSERHIRGGLAVKEKFRRLREGNNIKIQHL